MSEYFEIAYAATSNRLCLFTGTGFSKSISENKIPSWQELLQAMCKFSDSEIVLKDSLFPESGKNPLSLEETAQVIAIDLQKKGINIHEQIAQLINNINLEGDNEEVKKFLSNNSLRIVTTNYDKLVEQLIGGDECHSLTPGRPIPRSSSRIKIYHVHGSVDSPEHMVVTSDDYFRFINGQTYFSKKLSTVLHENTVVIIGYSLGDTNLKAIISDYKGFSRGHVVSSNIFLISRQSIMPAIKDYYAHCYGIRVIDNTEISTFFEQLNNHLPVAEACKESSLKDIRRVIDHKEGFSKDFLSIENSFYEILSSIGAFGKSLNDPDVVRVLGEIIQIKIELTGGHGDWVQYEHLASWLIYLASIIELKDTSIEEVFLTATLKSMNTMRRELYLGYSWQTYKLWDSKWQSIIASNRVMIKEHINSETSWPDALSIVNR